MRRCWTFCGIVSAIVGSGCGGDGPYHVVTTSVSLAGNIDRAAKSGEVFLTASQVYGKAGEYRTIVYQFSNITSPVISSPDAPTGAVSSCDWSMSIWDDPSTTFATSSSPGNHKLYFDAMGEQVFADPLQDFQRVTIPEQGAWPSFPVKVFFGHITLLSSSASVSVNNQDGCPVGGCG